MKFKLIIIILLILPVINIVLSNGLYMYLDGSYWPLTKEVAKNNFLNEFRSFVVNNASSGYDKNLFTGSRIFSNGIIYFLVSFFGIYFGKIIYLYSGLLLLIHALYKFANSFFISDKINACLFAIFFGVSGIYLNSTNQIYLYTIPAIFYSLYFSFIFLKTGKYRYIPLLIISGYFLLGYIRYVMLFGLFFIAISIILFDQIKKWISIKKIVILGISGLISFSLPIISVIYLSGSDIPTSSSTFAQKFSWYYPNVGLLELINYYYAFNFERDFRLAYIFSWMIGVLIIISPLWLIIQKKQKKGTQYRLYLVSILFILLYLTIALYEQGYFMILKVLPLIQNQPLYLVYIVLFLGTLTLYSKLNQKYLTYLTFLGVIGFGLYWNSFHYFPEKKINETINYTHKVGKNGYNYINVPTLYLPHALLDYGDFKSINLHDFTNFPSIGVNNARLFFGNTYEYNKDIRENKKIDIDNYKENTNLKLIKVGKHVFDDLRIERKRQRDLVQVRKFLESGEIISVGEDDYYWYYSLSEGVNEDYFIHGKDKNGFADIDVYVNNLNDDGYIIQVNSIGSIELKLLTSFSKNWKLEKINNPEILRTENCTSFKTTLNSYCTIENNINKYLYNNILLNNDITPQESESGRNIFYFENEIKGQIYALYYKSHPIKDVFVYIQNFLD